MENYVTNTSYVIVACCPVGITLHIVGFYLLVKAKKSQMDAVERIIVISLCLAEVFANAILFIDGLLDFASIRNPKFLYAALRSFLAAYYFSTLCLTFNRFLRLYLSIRYHSIWSQRKMLYFLIVLWVFSCITGCLVSSLLLPRNIVGIIDLFFDAVIVFLPIFVYGYALNLSRIMSKNKSLIQERKSAFKGLLLSAMIVLSYIVFTAIPHTIFLCHILTKKTINSVLHLILDITLVMAFWSDAIIYIYMCKHIRKHFKFKWAKTLSRKRCAIKPTYDDKTIIMVDFSK